MTIRIEQALNQKLNNYVLAREFPIDVKWGFYQDNIEPSIIGLHLRQNMLKAETVTVGMEDTGSNDHNGIYQIMVCGEVGEPSRLLKEEIDNILTEFKRGQRITYSGATVIIEKAFEAPSLVSEAYQKVPVSIRYRAFLSN